MKTAEREARNRVASPTLHGAYVFSENVVFLAYWNTEANREGLRVLSSPRCTA